MEGAVGVPLAAQPGPPAAQSQPNSLTTAGPEATAGPEKHRAPAAQSSGDSGAAPSCHITGGGSADAGTPVTEPSSAPQVAPGGHDTGSVRTAPTVALARPPSQSSPHGSQSSATRADSSAQVVTSAVVTARSQVVLQNPRAPAPVAAGGIRNVVPQGVAPRPGQPQLNAKSIQNIQLPAGMVLVRSESGQLLMIHQQTLAQMQSQSAIASRSATPTSVPSVQVTSLQAPGASLLARSVTPTAIIKQASTVASAVTATTTLQRPPVLQNTIMLGGSASSAGQLPGKPTTVQATAPRMTPLAVTAETLENVKKCKNFLATLIKLASNGKQTSETSAHVKELVKKLLEAKMEPEDFTSKLYQELNSSPQPYLVPFLKRSLPALRQMTPDSDAFIQQSLLPQQSIKPAVAATAVNAVVLRPTASSKPTMISLSQGPSKPGMIVPRQHHGAVVRPQVSHAASVVTIRGHAPSRILVGPPQVLKQLPVAALKQTVAPGFRGFQASLSEAQKNKLKEAGGGTFKDEDDINDVASMAGVNLSEESARILASGSELVGMVTRSCKDEAFLSTALLTRIVLQIGKRFGVGELGAEVISFISLATQQRLQNILEKASQVAQQKNTSFKMLYNLQEDVRHEAISDVRAQLKFFEQLDQLEKQRKEEQEREILLKAAKSRSRQEDPEQLRLKQKAKEMQQLELAQIRQREANMTALAAIGPRRKRIAESPLGASGAEGPGSGPAQPGGPNGSRQFARQRITRVNLRDLLFCLENEKESSRSQLLYKGLLK